ncbi:metalloproteinase inhibitor 2-like [Stigmatopora nigra]
MSFMLKTLLLPLALLCLMLLQEGAQGCRCAPKHAQEYFCQSEVVITAKVGQKTIDKTNHRVKYDIQLTRTIKGPKKIFDTIYSTLSSAACGVFLTKDTEYLFMARLWLDGTLYISSCDFFAQWRTLSSAQKNLLYRYQLGCDCKITVCDAPPCAPSGPMGCTWTRFLPARHYEVPMRNLACVKKGGGSCAWERGLDKGK